MPSDDQPPQFSLRAMFAATTGVAVIFGLFHWLGGEVLVTLLTVLLVLIAAADVAMQNKRFVAIVGLGFLGLFVFVAITSIVSESGSLHAARRAQCTNNLKQIGIALYNYADVYGSFPPTYIADANGRPLHSWRVLILPYTGDRGLYDRYDFSEPWDGPNNRLLAKEIPYCFQCPSDASLRGMAHTNYVAITGPQTVWPDGLAVSLDEVSDGTARTLAVVEVAHSGINWMEPRDLPFSALDLGINPPIGAGVSSEHPDLAQVLFCDGTVHALESPISVKTLKALATKSGGEKIDEEY